MFGLPDETVAHILAVLTYTETATNVVHVCRAWRELRASAEFRAMREAVDERGLVVAGGRDESGRHHRLRVLVSGRWCELAPLPLDERIVACCATDAMMVVVCSVSQGSLGRLRSVRGRLRSVQPGSVEGWISIPDPPVEVLTQEDNVSLCCIEGVLYVVGGVYASGNVSDALQSFDFTTSAWTVRAPVPDERCFSACVALAGRIYVVGGVNPHDDDVNLLASVFSYDPRTDRWMSEPPLPLGNYGDYYEVEFLRAVAHEVQVVVVGLTGAPPLALADGSWTELPPLPPSPGCFAAAAAQSAYVASFRLC